MWPFRGIDDLSTGALGARGERAAAWYLRRRRYRILARNVDLGFGEIDLIALTPARDVVVFVEVKTLRLRLRAGTRFRPEDHVTAAKRRRLERLSRAWMAGRGRQIASRWRVDVIGIEYPDRRRRPMIRHHPGVSGVHTG